VKTRETEERKCVGERPWNDGHEDVAEAVRDGKRGGSASEPRVKCWGCAAHKRCRKGRGRDPGEPQTKNTRSQKDWTGNMVGKETGLLIVKEKARKGRLKKTVGRRESEENASTVEWSLCPPEIRKGVPEVQRTQGGTDNKKYQKGTRFERVKSNGCLVGERKDEQAPF